VRLRRCLSSEELARADRYRFQGPAHRFVIGRAVLRSLLGGYLGAAPGEISLATGKHGKPHLAGDDQGWLRFNLAHAGDLLLYSFCPDHPVGIDAEIVRPLDALSYLKRTFLTTGESCLLNRLSPDDQQRVLMTACVCKEAYVKGLGMGIRAASDVRLLTPETLPWFLGRGPDSISGSGSAATWRLRRLNPAPGYVAALATAGPVHEIVGYDVASPLILE
jgi:4'-phosphopantetheinyl transferase